MGNFNQEGEIWRPVVGYENLYEVSNLGQVKSLGNNKNRKEKVLKPGTNKVGYLLVVLWKGGKGETIQVHRLVAQAFPEVCGETFQGWEADHINTIRTDNRAENLRVCTHKQNSNNPLSKKAYSKANKGKGVIPIIQLTLSGDFIKTWPSGKDITITLGIAASSVCNVCKGKLNTAGGFKWRYAN